MIDDNIIVEDTLINNNGRGRFYASSEQWKYMGGPSERLCREYLAWPPKCYAIKAALIDNRR